MMLPEGFTATHDSNIGIKYVAEKSIMEVFYLRSAKKRYGVVYFFNGVPESEVDKILGMGSGSTEYLNHEFQESYKLASAGMKTI